MDKPHNLTLGSLFDGVGGFPYAASFFGIDPLWASEILPSAVAVTKRHFPNMEHVGDITQLHGGDLPPVDIITFGSPCQDVSAAGRRAGINGARSSLFFEAIRIINEMREATNGKYPSYALWENVVGATNSNGGLDYKTVLEAFAEAEAPMPRSGKWAPAGLVRSRAADIAWCIYDARNFGTAQRRRRIFLIASFGSRRAGEILFKSKSLRGYFEAGGTPRQGAAAYAQGGAGSTDFGIAFACNQRDEARDLHDCSAALCAQPGMKQQTFLATKCLNAWDTQQSRVFTEHSLAPTMAGCDGGGGRHPGTLLCLDDQGGERMSVGKTELSPTLRSETHGNLPVICAASPQANAEMCNNLCPTITEAAGTSGNKPYILCAASSAPNAEMDEDKSSTLTCRHDHQYICKAIHQNMDGNLTTSDTAYALTTASGASARNAPLVMTETKENPNSHTAFGLATKDNGDAHLAYECHTALLCDGQAEQGYPAILEAHPEVAGTLCASGAGLSRPGGMASETDLCVAYCLQGNMIGCKDENGPRGSGINEHTCFTLNTVDVPAVSACAAIPICDKATRYKGGGPTRNNDGSGNGLGIGKDGDPSPTITAGDRHAVAVDCRNLRETEELSGTLQAKETGGYSLNSQNPVRTGYILRRLTPTEAERFI